MAHYAALTLQIAAGSLGAFFICIRLFLYESEQGQLHSKIEDLWIRVHDLQRQAVSRHLALSRITAGSIDSFLNRVFGAKLFSLQSVTVSLCYAVAVMLLFTLFSNRYFLKQWNTDLEWLIGIFLACASAPLFISYFKSKQTYMVIWFSVLYTLAFVNIFSPGYEVIKFFYFSEYRFMVAFILISVLAVVIAFAVYVLSVSTVRFTLRILKNSQSVMKTLLASLLSLFPLATFYLVWKIALFKIEQVDADELFPNQLPEGLAEQVIVIQKVLSSWTARVDLFLVFLLLNFFLFGVVFVFTAALFLLFALFMLLHRLFWPIIERALYATQRFSIIKEGRILIIIGAVLIALSLRLYSLIPGILGH